MLIDFAAKHPDVQSSLTAWLDLMRKNHFKHFSDLKSSFGSADYKKPDTIFNISGNKYRLIANVSYTTGIVLIKQMMTHAEYDRWGKQQRGN